MHNFTRIFSNSLTGRRESELKGYHTNKMRQLGTQAWKIATRGEKEAISSWPSAMLVYLYLSYWLLQYKRDCPNNTKLGTSFSGQTRFNLKTFGVYINWTEKSYEIFNKCFVILINKFTNPEESSYDQLSRASEVGYTPLEYPYISVRLD